jgi:CDP-diacylglycerol--glycerol-3-phosphate 3-phosphatidyltransferase
MTAGRAALGPVMVLGAACGWNGMAMAGMVVVALVSDIFDGVLARRWSCDTSAVRLFDTIADTFFYLGAGLALWLVRPEVWRKNAVLLAVLVGMEVFRIGFDCAKYGKMASYHSYVAKIWGLVLATAVVTAFARGDTGGLMTLALAWGVVCQVEGLAMSLMLREWHRDVKTIGAALQLRRDAALRTRGAANEKQIPQLRFGMTRN